MSITTYISTSVQKKLVKEKEEKKKKMKMTLYSQRRYEKI